MINVEDRIPAPGQEGQVTITPAAGDPITGSLAMADNPTKQGTPWSHQTARMLQADIRSYTVSPNTTVVAGDVVDIEQEEVIIVDVQLSSIAEGQTIILNENGSPVEFYVAKHNYETGLNGDGRTLVVRKDVYDQRQWHSSNTNAWASCSMRSWLNSTYKALLDAAVQEAMGTTTYRYTPGNGNNTVSTRSDSVFLLSLTELGQSNTFANLEGSALPIASTLWIAYQNSSATTQWTRSPVTVNTSNALGLDYGGGISIGDCVYSYGSRPAFTLPSTFVVGQTEENVPLDGTYVTNTITPLANTETVIASEGSSYIAVTKLNDLYSVATWNGRVALLSNENGSLANSPMSLTAGVLIDSSIARLTDSLFVVSHVNTSQTEMNVRAVLVSGTTFSSPNYITFTGTYNAIVPLSDSSFILFRNSGGTKACVCTVSGTTITKGSDVALSGNTSASYISATRLPDDGGNKRVCVCYADAAVGEKAVLCTISASNSVSWGSPVNLYSDAATSQTSCVYDGEDVIVAFSNATNYVFVRTLSAKTLAIKAQLDTDIRVGGYGLTLVFSEVGTVICTGNNGWANSNVVIKSVGNISLGDTFQWNNAASQYMCGTETSGNKIMLIYADNGNGNYGTSTILTIRGNQIAGGFENTSSKAIALTSASAGEMCEVIFDGVTQLSSVTAGQEITSPGVYGYCPMDGWIWVRPWWGVRLLPLSGYYTGNDAQNRVINLGVTPSAVLVVQTGFDFYSTQNWVKSGLAVSGFSPTASTGDSAIKIVENGFQVTYRNQNGNAAATNQSGYTYAYIAII